MKETLTLLNGKETAGLIFALLLVFVLFVLILGGTWWIVLWSFNFPIAFAWKQLIGVILVSGMVGGSSFKYKKTKKTKGTK